MQRLTQKYPFSWARVVSDVFSPPVVWAAMALSFALQSSSSPQWAMLWAMIYITLVCLLPVFYIMFMVWQDKITDIHMKVRQQRTRPLIVSLMCAGGAWGILWWMGAPVMIRHLSLYTVVLMALMTLITLVWQISLHTISISGATIATGALFGPFPALLTLPLVLLVGAARLKLKRHTPAQVLAGVVVGLLIPLFLFSTIATL